MIVYVATRTLKLVAPDVEASLLSLPHAYKPIQYAILNSWPGIVTKNVLNSKIFFDWKKRIDKRCIGNESLNNKTMRLMIRN